MGQTNGGDVEEELPFNEIAVPDAVHDVDVQ